MYRLEFAENHTINPGLGLAPLCLSSSKPEFKSGKLSISLCSRRSTLAVGKSSLAVLISSLLFSLASPSFAATEFTQSTNPTSNTEASKSSINLRIENTITQEYLNTENVFIVDDGISDNGSRLLNYSAICVNKAKKENSERKTKNNRSYARTDLTRIDLPNNLKTDQQDTVSSNDIDDIVNSLENPESFYSTSEYYSDTNNLLQDGTSEKRWHGGSAVGAIMRMSLKSWWKNNQGSQLHTLSSHAPESIRTGKLSGRAKYQWDYSLKLSHDDVKFKLEKAF